MTMIYAAVRYAIADELGIANELIDVQQVYGDTIWFSIPGGAGFTCRTVRNGTRLKKNSIRKD